MKENSNTIFYKKCITKKKGKKGKCSVCVDSLEEQAGGDPLSLHLINGCGLLLPRLIRPSKSFQVSHENLIRTGIFPSFFFSSLIFLMSLWVP